MAIFPGLVILGFCVGAFGTLIGSGGGFILAPVLLLLYPHENPWGPILKSLGAAPALVGLRLLVTALRGEGQ